MIGIPALVDAVGSALLRLVAEGDGAEVADLTLAEPAEGVLGLPGDLVLGVGAGDPGQAARLVEQVAEAGAGGVILRAPLGGSEAVVATAERAGIAVVELAPHASWAHLVWLLRGVFDRTPGTAVLPDAGVHGELFALADAAAAILDAPVTIEDAQSRVLAYSGRQESTDPARVSTIVGRRVPEPVLAHFRARGVFRRLARSNEPIYVADGPEGTKPRLVLPVRAGGEWLGSIWAVVPGPVDPDRVDQLTRATSVLALHLLRLRAQTGANRRASIEHLRTVLTGVATGAADPWLPDPPWRVVAFGVPPATSAVDARLDLWTAISHRYGWQHPLLTDVDGTVFGLLTEPGGTGQGGTGQGDPRAAGTLPWLRAVVEGVNPNDADLTAAVGGRAAGRDDLPQSRAEAAELLRLQAAGLLDAPVVRIEDAWDAVVVARARAAVRVADGLLGGPLPALVAHDRDHGTRYVETLSAWLDHPGDPKAAAAALHIHPNTLRHRMRRIGEVAPLDLASPRSRLALRLQALGLTGQGC
ncbi:PucR family transcriptional regulator [Pseudonocardia sichuanensis]